MDISELRYKPEPKFGDEAKEWSIGIRKVHLVKLHWSMLYPKKPKAPMPGPSDYYPNYHIAKPSIYEIYFEKERPPPPQPLIDEAKLFPKPNSEMEYDAIKSMNHVKSRIHSCKFADEPFSSEQNTSVNTTKASRSRGTSFSKSFSKPKHDFEKDFDPVRAMNSIKPRAPAYLFADEQYESAPVPISNKKVPVKASHTVREQ